MAAFFERLGHRVVQTESSYWYNVHPWFYLSFPFNRLVTPRPPEISRLCRGFYAGARFFAPPQATGRSSYMFMCRDRSYGLEGLSPNTRSKVRRGLKNCVVERLEPGYVRTRGRPLHEDTLRRIKVQDPYSWEAYWDAVEQSDCIEVWGAILEKNLAAYLVAVMVDGCGEIMIVRSTSEYLRFYPNNALLFTAVQDMLSRPGVDRLWFGVEALEDVSSTDQFKLSMGFVKEPICQRVALHPLLRPVACNALVSGAVGRLASAYSQTEFWRKLNGLLALAGSA
jgi:hypothetical protein